MELLKLKIRYPMEVAGAEPVEIYLMEKNRCVDGQVQDSQLNKSRIEMDTNQVRHSYCHIAKPETFEEWLNTPIPNFENKTPSELISDGRALELVTGLESIFDGGFT